MLRGSLLRKPFCIINLRRCINFRAKFFEAIEIWVDIRDVSSLFEFAKTAEERGDWVATLDANTNVINLDLKN